MNIGSTLLLLASALPGQDTQLAGPEAAVKRLQLHARTLSARDMLRAMVAQDQARRSQPGATVEVIGYDDETALQLLAMTIRNRVRLEFRDMDKRQHQELCAFMHQDPTRPGPAPLVPLPAGAKGSRAEDIWLK